MIATNQKYIARQFINFVMSEINFFSKTVVTVLQKIFGIILGALSIQFIIDGIKESFM